MKDRVARSVLHDKAFQSTANGTKLIQTFLSVNSMICVYHGFQDQDRHAAAPDALADVDLSASGEARLSTGETVASAASCRCGRSQTLRLRSACDAGGAAILSASPA